jgi:hypothetical protein
MSAAHQDNEAASATDPLLTDAVPPAPRKRAGTEDWLTAAVVFAILGGCAALWLFDLSPVIGAAAAVLSAVAGVVFADG